MMAGRGEHKASENRITAAERQRQALELRKAGVDYRAIGERLGYSTAGAHKAVMTALKAITKEPAEEVLDLELRRLDAMLVGLWPKAVKGDTWAVDRVLAIMDRRARYLGLDAPTKTQTTLTVESAAKAIADDLGLSTEEVIAEAERILIAGART